MSEDSTRENSTRLDQHSVDAEIALRTRRSLLTGAVTLAAKDGGYRTRITKQRSTLSLFVLLSCEPHRSLVNRLQHLHRDRVPILILGPEHRTHFELPHHSDPCGASGRAH